MKQGVDYIGVCVTFACHDGQGNFLLAKRGQNSRDERGTWDCGGGAIDFGDNIEQTLRKEIKEEYCTDVLDFEFMGYRDVHRVNDDGLKTHWIALDFKVRVDREQAANGEPHKLDEIGWFPLDSFPSPVHSQIPVWFKQNEQKLRAS
jgi:8-oxo-dGTP diphosphatase